MFGSCRGAEIGDMVLGVAMYLSLRSGSRHLHSNAEESDNDIGDPEGSKAHVQWRVRCSVLLNRGYVNFELPKITRYRGVSHRFEDEMTREDAKHGPVLMQ